MDIAHEEQTGFLDSKEGSEGPAVEISGNVMIKKIINETKQTMNQKIPVHRRKRGNVLLFLS